MPARTTWTVGDRACTQAHGFDHPDAQLFGVSGEVPA
jgi:hypothetical protein